MNKEIISYYELIKRINNKTNPKKVKVRSYFFEWSGFNYCNVDEDEEYYEFITNLIAEIDFFEKLIEIIDEENDEFEDIKENDDILRFDDIVCPYGPNEEKFMKYIIIYQKQINSLIRNQKKIIERLNKDE